jgi:hypothetical protein
MVKIIRNNIQKLGRGNWASPELHTHLAVEVLVGLRPSAALLMAASLSVDPAHPPRPMSWLSLRSLVSPVPVPMRPCHDWFAFGPRGLSS